eukprot:CAMPEP_0183355336 /NCGR_PEP_ID=MMETSP0164_2-20130417/39988_1 /TAXON_ID=221442 /ORGANISM="Coccolithus pelagicus ssp braarudi, Strain PLY182g" /LENGTH=189 /DNA_ID=CAMNT_0025528415 /DNA_START=14 /DNA_END=583 /DNA_ORIENTATION=+
MATRRCIVALGLLGLPCALALAQVRADSLLVANGMFHSRAAAKEAIAAGLVATRSGALVRKASLTFNEETQFVSRSEATAENANLPDTPSIDGPSSIASDEVDTVRWVVGDNTLVPLRPVARRKSASARAALFRNGAERSNDGPQTNVFGLRGRGKNRGNGAAGNANSALGGPTRPKHYSKKNKRGVAV